MAAKGFKELTEKQQKFLEHYADTGKHAESCRYAGFNVTSGYNCLEKHGHILEEMVQKKIAEAGLGGLSLLRQLIQNTKNDMVKFNAIKYLMNLAGYVPTEKRELTVSGMTEEQIDRELSRLIDESENVVGIKQAK